MFRAKRALRKSGAGAPKLPLLDGLQPLYNLRSGVYPRKGNMVMIAGRGGAGKSSFALWLTQQWGMDTLYFSADMTATQATQKLVANKTQTPSDTVEQHLNGEDAEKWLSELDDSKIHFVFTNPITFERIIDEINTYVVLYNRYPEMMVFDNLANFEGAETEYSEQFFALSVLLELTRKIGSTTIVLHHAKDTSWDAKDRPWYPPSRNEVKGGHFEYPEMVLGVSLNNLTQDFHIAPLKNRVGFQDPTAQTFASLRVDSQTNTFYSSDDYLSNGA